MSRKPTPLCVVRLGHVDYLMSMADGLRVVELLARARPVERDYRQRSPIWRQRTDRISVELTGLQADQIISTPDPAARAVPPSLTETDHAD